MMSMDGEGAKVKELLPLPHPKTSLIDKVTVKKRVGDREASSPTLTSSRLLCLDRNVSLGERKRSPKEPFLSPSNRKCRTKVGSMSL